MERKEIEIKYSCRMNFWKKTKDQFDILLNTECLICPYYHSFDQLNIINHATFEIDTNNLNEKENKFFDILIDDYIIIFSNENRKKAYICKIKSEPYVKQLLNVKIYRKNKYQNKFGDNVCRVQLIDKEIDFQYDKKETMWAIVRDLEIIKEIDNNEKIFIKYGKFQSCIIRNRQSERFIEIN